MLFYVLGPSFVIGELKRHLLRLVTNCFKSSIRNGSNNVRHLVKAIFFLETYDSVLNMNKELWFIWAIAACHIRISALFTCHLNRLFHPGLIVRFCVLKHPNL